MAGSALLSPVIASPEPLWLATTSFSMPASQIQWVEHLRTHARNGLFEEAISDYVAMTSAGIPPDHFTFPAVLKAATGLRDHCSGTQLHAAAVKFGYQCTPVTVANTLVTMYARCGALDCALKVFDGLPDRDQVSWNSVINALCMFEEWELALEGFFEMQSHGFAPSSFTLVSVMLACSNLRNWREGLRLGKLVHGRGLRAGFYTEGKTFTNNSLIAMYAKLGRLSDSLSVFERLNNCDLVSWNTMISAFAQNDQFAEALALLRRMVLTGIKPDGVTLSSVLPVFSHLELFGTGKEIHAYAVRNDDLFENSFVASALVNMYSNCKRVDCARQVFYRITERRIGLWNALIAGYVQNGLDDEALCLFIDMLLLADVALCPNSTTLATVIPATVRSEAFHSKENVHGYVVKRGFANDPFVQNALIDMYARMGKVDVSLKIFERMGAKDIVSWNTIITGFSICGLYHDAFNLFIKMQWLATGRLHEGYNGYNAGNKCSTNLCGNEKPNVITLITILPACAVLAALNKGKEIHAYAIRNALASETTVGSALVDMYAKSGCLTYSKRVFDRMPNRNVITWNVLIMAYGMHGHGAESLRLFLDMVARGKVRGPKPNDVTFISVFAACSHSGMVTEGMELFHCMRAHYGIEPTPDHYACIVDLLGRAGRLEEAYRLITTVEPGQHLAGAWSSLLGACRVYRNVRLGEISANHLFCLEPNVASHYVLLSNIYSSEGLWEKAMEVRNRMKEIGIRKEPGCSWIEIGDDVHQFLVGDSLHPQSEQLHSHLEILWERLRKEGYVPDTSCVLHNVHEEEKKMLLCGHSEKLAIAFGLLNTPQGSTIKVVKNLRICNDCHNFAKYASRVLERLIIVRDVRRFHHFKDGTCTCGDYW